MSRFARGRRGAGGRAVRRRVIKRRVIRRRVIRRRGVSSVLAMMMAILVASLAAAMATVTQGNLRTAATHVHVMRAMNAAETGIAVAEYRLRVSASRFRVEQSDLAGGFGDRLWRGATSGSDGQVLVASTREGNSEASEPAGIARAVANLHEADIGTVEVAGITGVSVGPAPGGADTTVYASDYWVTTPGVALRPVTNNGVTPSAFQITYAPLADGETVRAIVTGYDFDPTRPGLPLTRTIAKDFRIVKKVRHAVVSNSRVLIGKNVAIEGDMGTTFEDVDVPTGNPAVIRSDFRGIDPGLDAKIDRFYQQLEAFDVDGDNRVRVGHAIEGGALSDDQGDSLNLIDFDSDGNPDGAFDDVTGDGYVDEFDLFINHFDRNGDGRVTLGGWLAAGTPAALESPEFTDGGGGQIDEDLAYLIDSSSPDRNENGISGWVETTGDGIWNAGSENALDYDDVHGTWADQVLGWRDGYIDRRDLYAKIDGQLVFRVSAAQWAAHQGDIFDNLQGSIAPEDGLNPLVFQANEELLPTIDATSFTETQSALYAAANGDAFWDQVADNLGTTPDQLPAYVEVQPSGGGVARYLRLDPDANADGLPDNYTTAYFEKMPFNSPRPVDWYYRPVFEEMEFKNVVLPRGLNALFVDCTFAGVTRIESYADNTHPNWSLYGELEFQDPYPVPQTNPLDKSDFARYVTGNLADGPQNYDVFPDPPVIDSVVMTGADRDTKRYSNNIRFHDCLFVGSLVGDVPQTFTHVRNKIQFTGTTRFAGQHPDAPNDSALNPDAGDLAEIAKSSLMLPNYSVDVGTFNSPDGQNVQLQGAIIAGVLDIRGNTEIDGALLLTFDPELGTAPLVDPFGNPIGNPADFNASLGYFGPEDGDEESFDPRLLPVVNGDPIVGWDLDGDGLSDTEPDYTPSQPEIDAGATSVPFNGYGRIRIAFDPDLILPDGLLLPLSIDPVRGSYQEGVLY